MHGEEGLAAGRCAAVDGDVNENELPLGVLGDGGQVGADVERDVGGRRARTSYSSAVLARPQTS